MNFFQLQKGLCPFCVETGICLFMLKYHMSIKHVRFSEVIGKQISLVFLTCYTRILIKDSG